jgi:phosphate-selective porin OprO/OprP
MKSEFRLQVLILGIAFYSYAAEVTEAPVPNPLAFFSPSLPVDQKADVIVKNAVLSDPDDPANDQVVTLVVKKGKLEIITADPVSDKSIRLVVNADRGFILGKLNVNESAGFMILSQDPRENADVFLDTKAFTTFAVKEGTIVRNSLLAASDEQDLVAQGDREWFAYNAPPMALSTSYKNQNKWNRFRSKYVNATLIGALALDRMFWLYQDDTSEAQVGDLKEYNEGEIRTLRFGLVGTLNFEKPWIYTFAAATHAFDKGFDVDDTDKIGIFDARLDIPFYQDTTLSIGKQKEPISMERLTSMVNLPMQERSAVSDAMMPSRNVGMVLSGTGLERRATWAGGVFNPWLDTGTSIGETSTQIVGRGTLLPVLSFNENSLIHLGAGIRYSNAKSGLRYATEPEFNQSTNFVDTGFLPAESSMLYDLELAWRYGPLLIGGEYVINQIDDPTSGNPTFTGYHVTLNYVLTGEMRPYNKRSGLFRPVPVAKPVGSGGWGAVEIAGRISNLDLNDGAVSGGNMDIYSLGFNWWLSTAASFGVNYRHVVLDDGISTGHSDGLMTRILLMLE